MTATASPLVIPPHLQERQRLASDPALSIWVSANAGSGKTHVLTQRVIRLLLEDVAPSKILCLTFTKAAAAQMSTRVFDKLSKWTCLDDGELRREIEATGARRAGPSELTRARRLFTRAVETPGGLKIQTIHAFCERLLHLFPFEANVPANFEVADERRTEEMLAQARHATIAALQGRQELALVADIAGSFGLHALLAQAMRLRAVARRSPFDPQTALGIRLGAASDASAHAVRHDMLEGGLSPRRRAAIASILSKGGKTDLDQANRLAAVAQASSPSEALTAYLSVFFGSDRAPRSRMIAKALRDAYPDILVDLEHERERLSSLREYLKIAETVERTQSLVVVADDVMERYERAKIAAGLLDFDDLIERTLALLENSSSSWVLHKLDAGIDHVLVDEAQDTSEAQWQILEKLTAEFASGITARPQDRSFFVVGDDKQSIFSFQGAAPLMFDEMRSRFEHRFKAGEKPFERVELKTSFRSVPGILAAVDKVFDAPLHRDGLVQGDNVWPIHESIKSRLPGLIEIWPRVGGTVAPDPAEWAIPVDMPAESDPVNVVADRVARKIRALIASDCEDRVHDGRSEVPRPVQAGDILVLVRTRGPFFEAVIRAMKNYGVPVAGADRLDVANHVAVMDLVAAGRAALLPDDDLSLACVLKSPLFSLDDDDLISLAPERDGALIDALATSDKPAHRGAHATIMRWSRRAVETTPFAFYVEVLGVGGGRRLMEARLGPEAHDAIDEFLRFALAHEQRSAPSLGTFLNDVEALESSIKRDMEAASDVVRVMTVHAAKGLEAKIVFLPDTCAVPAQTLEPTVFDINGGTAEPPLLVWSPRKADDPEPVEAARARERRATLCEYRRLLYVALTRAEERLYVAGFYNSREPPEDCWNAMIERSFATEAEEVEAPWGNETVRRIVCRGSAPAGGHGRPAVSLQGALGLAPNWLQKPIPSRTTPRPLRPSRLRPETENREGSEERDYGSALHLLLQYLPDIPLAERMTRAQAFLSDRPSILASALHDRLIAEALATLASPALADLLGPGSRAEVPILGRLMTRDGAIQEIHGTVDRIVELPDRIIAVDFKSGPQSDPPPADYVEQLALYHRVLRNLWPAKAVEMRLVWTRTGHCVAFDAQTLDSAATTILTSA